MKPPAEWTERDLYELPVGEFDWLEAKGRRALDLSVPGVSEAQVRDGLSKAASAFANTGGGILVLGIQNPVATWEVDDGGVALATKGRSTREWLEDVVPELVEHRLTRFNIYVIQRGDNTSQIAEGRGVFLIDVGDSDDAPHQAQDLRYYARVGGKSRPLGHRLVSDIFNRARHPIVDISISLEARDEGIKSRGSFLVSHAVRKVTLSICATNVGRVIANYVRIVVRIPILWTDDARHDTSPGDEQEFHFRNTRQDVLSGTSSLDGGFSPRYGPSWFDPLLPGLSKTWIVDLNKDAEKQMTVGSVAWSSHADSAPSRTGEVTGSNLLEHS